MRVLSRVLIVLSSVLPLWGCEDDLTPITFIKELEVLGGRVEVVGDEARNKPRPGEAYTFTPIYGWPERDPDLSQLSTLIVECTASDFVSTLPICLELIGDDALQAVGATDTDSAPPTEAPLFECGGLPQVTLGGLSLQCATGLPTFALQAPQSPEADGDGFRSRLIVGITCNGGDAALVGSATQPFTCIPREGRELLDARGFFGTVDLQGEDLDVNTNPQAESLDVRLRGPEDDSARPWRAWTQPEPPPEDACETAEALELPEVAFGEEVEIELRYDADAVETIDGERETIEISTYVNAGEVERRFTIFPGTDNSDATVGSLPWTAPSERGLADLERRRPSDPVRFTMIVRDGFDGMVQATYYLCLTSS